MKTYLHRASNLKSTITFLALVHSIELMMSYGVETVVLWDA